MKLMSTLASSEFNIEDYADFYDLDDLLIKDEVAATIIAAALLEQKVDAGTVIEIGESSNTSNKESYCGICMETKPCTEFYDTKFCIHSFCNGCISSYITDKVTDGIGWIDCPELGCEAGFLNPDSCSSMIPKSIMDRWGDLVCESTIEDTVYCPFKDCSALIVNDDMEHEYESIKESECPCCHRLFCVQCRSSWHEGMLCEEVQQLGKGDREREDLMLKEFAKTSDLYDLDDPLIKDEVAATNIAAALLELKVDSDTVIEIGESSNTYNKESYCGICMETKPRAEFYDTKFCIHSFCNGCISSYIIDMVNDGIGWIDCPELGCEAGFLNPDSCSSLIQKSIMDRWGDLVCESTIEDKVYCPFKDCSAVIVNDYTEHEYESIKESECPYCHRLFCVQCRSSWHEGMLCEEVQQLGKGDREREDLMLKECAKTSKWQMCPECKFFVEKDGGCNHITCRCKYEFCYICGAKWEPSHHRCTKAN